jgi:beta-glucuronidase
MLSVRLGEDDYRIRVGIRTILCSKGQVLINGNAVRLFGFNRHEAHPSFGCSLPPSLILTDIQLLRQMGCNFVRGSHYPQDPRFLDLCDELGIMVWCEAIGWGHPAAHLQDPLFMSSQQRHIEEMISELSHHPSIIVWGLLNESHSDDPSARAGYETLIQEIKKMDESRPVSYASNRAREDLCFDLVDIISFNSYPGWYHGGIDSVKENLDSVVAHIDGQGFEDKPIILSEIGAGAVYGTRDWHRSLWSEEYQEELLKEVIDYFNRQRRICGLGIWQFCDVRTTEETDRMLIRPRGFNNKGILDEYRRPKLAYTSIAKSRKPLKTE